MSYLPDVDWRAKLGGTGYVPQRILDRMKWRAEHPNGMHVASRSDINRVARKPKDSQAQVAADNAPLRVVYGRTRIGAQVADMLIWQKKLVMVLVWCEGEIEQIESVTANDEAITTGITLTHYTGTAGQTADATLVSAYLAQTPPVTYSDALPGIAYSVAVITGATNGFPNFAAIIKGRKLYDPRTGLTVYSDNPALALADFIASPSYGMGRSVNAASLTAAANFCDELCGADKRRLIGLALDNVQPVEHWLETLRTYAGCIVSPEGDEVLLVPDKAGTSVFSFNASNIVAGSLKLKKRGRQQVPTVMDIRYTDTSKLPWAEKSAIAKAAGVDAGTTPRRESQVSLPGILRYSQAMREAIERLNKLTLSDLSCEFDAFDEALALQVGDIIDVTHPIGLTAKLCRVTAAQLIEAGRWHISALEYDPLAYSDHVESEPSYDDTTLPNPAQPPAVTSLAMEEEVYQLGNGTWASRWRVTWDEAGYAYLAHYRAELWEGAALIHTTTTREAVWATPAIQEGNNYTAKVAAVSTIGSSGEWATQSAVAQGKQLIPGDVSGLSVFEAGGRVYISWAEAVDLDILRYDVRYGAVGGTWETATVLDHVDALRLQTDQIPAGTWTIYVKAEDSVRQYSTTAATCNVTVTSDSSSFVVDTLHQTNPGLTNMAEYSLARADANRYFVTEDAVAWDTKFSAALDTYTNALATYHNSVTSTWLGESEDFGLLLGGNWTGSATVADVGGSHISYLGHSTDGAAWTYLAGLTQKINARFARMKHEALTTSTLLVTIPAQNIRIDAIPREEVGSGTSVAANALSVFLTNDYVSTKKVSVSPTGSVFASPVTDNIGNNLPNPADAHANIILNGNIITKTGTAWTFVRARHPLPATGKWRWRVKIDNGGTYPNAILVGIAGRSLSLSSTYTLTPSVFYSCINGLRYLDGASAAYGASATTGDYIGVAYDADLGKIKFYKNNTAYAEITGLSGEYFPCFGLYKGDEQITVQFTESDMGTWDVAGFAPLPYGFDVHIFDAAGTRIARDFLWSFQGV